MASLTWDGGDRARIQFIDDDKRKAIRLGKVSLSVAELVKRNLEAILSVRQHGATLDMATAKWMESIGDTLHAKIAHAGLIEPRTRRTLNEFIDQYIAGRNDVKPGTIANWRYAQRQLIEFFGADRRLDHITSDDAMAFRRMVAQHSAQATVSGAIKRARLFFGAAVRMKIITESPFANVRAGLMTNAARKQFIERSTIERVLSQTTDPRIRLVIALSRYGGLRTPSEQLGLRWDDIDWEGGKIVIRSPKTEHHTGKDKRIIPLFTELLPFLEAMKAATDGGQWVVDRHRRSAATYWRSRFVLLIAKAGVPRWERLFHNMRASRQSELSAEYSLPTACEWIGNSQAVAIHHYVTSRPEDFAKASGIIAPPTEPPPVADVLPFEPRQAAG